MPQSSEPPLAKALSSKSLPTYFYVLAVGACFVVVVAGLRTAQAICVPFLVALFVTMLSRPLMRGLLRRRAPVGLAVATTLLVVAAVLATLGSVLSLSLSRVTVRLPQYQERFQEETRDALSWLEAQGLDTRNLLAPEAVDLEPLLNLATGTFLGVANVVTGMVLMLLMTTFLLLESGGFEEKLRRVLGERGELLERYSRISEEVQRYLWIKTLISLATGFCIGGWVAVIGLDFPLLWGFIAFLLNYIPNIGSILASIPAFGLAIVQLGPSGAFLVLLGYVLTNILWGSLVEPQVLGRRLRLSPLAVFLSLVFWGWVWGPLGMLLSVPITMVLKIAMENSEGLSEVAGLLDPPPRAPSP